MLRKLHSFGFCGYLPLFIRNCSVNRTSRVRIGDTLSPSLEYVEGILQGSVLIFLCFTNVAYDVVTAVADFVLY